MLDEQAGEVLAVKGARARVPFTMSPNALLRDTRLSSDARFFLIYLESHDDDWVFHMSVVRRQTGWGRDKLRAVIRECRDAGCLRVSQSRSPATGQMGTPEFSVDWGQWF